jgi:hypothetical protein
MPSSKQEEGSKQPAVCVALPLSLPPPRPSSEQLASLGMLSGVLLRLHAQDAYGTHTHARGTDSMSDEDLAQSLARLWEARGNE